VNACWTRLTVAALAAVLLAAQARAAAPSPDAHDRALAAQLNARAKTFRNIASATSQQSQDSLDRCPVFRKNPQDALSAFFLLIPVFLSEIVNDYGSEITDLRDAMTAMSPDSPLFRKWLTAETGNLTLLLQFDNHGKKVDLCKAAAVLLDTKSTGDDIFHVTGLRTTVIAQLFSNEASAAVTKLNPQMRPFLVAAGLSAADAKTLTSS
jgi:hypothetical protein